MVFKKIITKFHSIKKTLRLCHQKEILEENL